MNISDNFNDSKSLKVISHSCGDVDVLKKYINIKTGNCYLLLQFWHSSTIKTEKILQRSDIYKNSNVLIDCGADINDFKDFLQYISYQESILDISYIHTNVGWFEFNEEQVFQYYNAYPILSEYAGNLDIKPKGSYQGWKRTVEEFAMSQIALQLAIVLGLSAVTAGFLKEELDGSLLVHLYGASSKGKTTFAMLAVSTAGNPNPTAQNTLMCDWSDTSNYKISMLANNNGFPVVFDELSKAIQKDVSDFCYNVSNGRDKGRLSSSAECKDVPTWSTTVISTGESSLLSQCNNNGGLLVRVLELSIDTITESAHTAEQLKSGIINNYGFANIKIAKCLLKNKGVIKRKFAKWRIKIESDIPVKNNLIARLSKKLAVIMLTAEISKIVLKLDFNISKIERVLIDSIIKQNERCPFDIGEKLVQYLLEDMVSHPEHYQKYIKNGQKENICHNRKAIIKNINNVKVNDNESSNKEIQFIPSKFKELLKNGGFSDVTLCLNELKHRGYLVTEKGHNTVKRVIDGNQVRVYAIRFPDSLIQ